MKLTLHAFLPEVAAIFRDDHAKYFLSRAHNPGALELLDQALVPAFIAKAGYSLSPAVELEPSDWVRYRSDLSLRAHSSNSRELDDDTGFKDHTLDEPRYQRTIAHAWKDAIQEAGPRTTRIAFVGPLGSGKSSLLGRLTMAGEGSLVPRDFARFDLGERSLELFTVDLTQDDYVGPLRDARAWECSGFIFVTSFGFAAPTPEDFAAPSTNSIRRLHKLALQRKIDSLNILREFLEKHRPERPWWMVVVSNKSDLMHAYTSMFGQDWPAEVDPQSDYHWASRTRRLTEFGEHLAKFKKAASSYIAAWATARSCAKIEAHKIFGGEAFFPPYGVGESERDCQNRALLSTVAACMRAASRMNPSESHSG